MGWINESMNGLMNGSMDVCVNGLINVQVDGWEVCLKGMDEWMDMISEWIDVWDG